MTRKKTSASESPDINPIIPLYQPDIRSGTAEDDAGEGEDEGFEDEQGESEVSLTTSNYGSRTRNYGTIKTSSLQSVIDQAQESTYSKTTVPDKNKINNEQANKIIDRLAVVHGISKFLALIAIYNLFLSGAATAKDIKVPQTRLLLL